MFIFIHKKVRTCFACPCLTVLSRPAFHCLFASRVSVLFLRTLCVCCAPFLSTACFLSVPHNITLKTCVTFLLVACFFGTHKKKRKRKRNKKKKRRNNKPESHSHRFDFSFYV